MSAVYITARGVIGTDPRRSVWNGRPLLSFRMVCNERRYDNLTGNWADVHASWLGVSCSGELAHNVDASVRKGDRVLVHGKIRVKEYLGNDGTRRTGVDLHADVVGPDLNYGIATLRPKRRRPDPDEQLTEHAEALQRQLDDEPRLTVAELVAQRAALTEEDDDPGADYEPDDMPLEGSPLEDDGAVEDDGPDDDGPDDDDLGSGVAGPGAGRRRPGLVAVARG